MKYEGKTWTYGDNIDTDVIIPARYLNSFDPKELASHCMVDIDESFAKEVKAGDIMVGGWNFGCGSSREHAPLPSSIGRTRHHCRKLCPDLLPQRHQRRPSCPGNWQRCQKDSKRRHPKRRYQHGYHCR